MKPRLDASSRVIISAWGSDASLSAAKGLTLGSTASESMGDAIACITAKATMSAIVAKVGLYVKSAAIVVVDVGSGLGSYNGAK